MEDPIDNILRLDHGDRSVGSIRLKPEVTPEQVMQLCEMLDKNGGMTAVLNDKEIYNTLGDRA